jgi:hypothetical protein
MKVRIKKVVQDNEVRFIAQRKVYLFFWSEWFDSKYCVAEAFSSNDRNLVVGYLDKKVKD